MIDIDQTIKRIYKNPYEEIRTRKYTCRLCGRGIYAMDKHRKIYSGAVCEVCIEKDKLEGE